MRWSNDIPIHQMAPEYANYTSYPVMPMQPTLLKSVKLVTPFFSNFVPDNPILIQTVSSASLPPQHAYPVNAILPTKQKSKKVGNIIA